MFRCRLRSPVDHEKQRERVKGVLLRAKEGLSVLDEIDRRYASEALEEAERAFLTQ
jgi:hypothetical protein